MSNLPPLTPQMLAELSDQQLARYWDSLQQLLEQHAAAGNRPPAHLIYDENNVLAEYGRRQEAIEERARTEQPPYRPAGWGDPPEEEPA